MCKASVTHRDFHLEEDLKKYIVVKPLEILSYLRTFVCYNIISQNNYKKANHPVTSYLIFLVLVKKKEPVEVSSVYRGTPN